MSPVEFEFTNNIEYLRLENSDCLFNKSFQEGVEFELIVEFELLMFVVVLFEDFEFELDLLLIEIDLEIEIETEDDDDKFVIELDVI